eukprot:1437266-Pyramimonas_sp.AAC.1
MAAVYRFRSRGAGERRPCCRPRQSRAALPGPRDLRPCLSRPRAGDLIADGMPWPPGARSGGGGDGRPRARD